MRYGFSVSFNYLRENKYSKDVSAGYFHVTVVLQVKALTSFHSLFCCFTKARKTQRHEEFSL